jgi:isoquinoline 1-oxidoreductase beta subunit
MTTKVNANDLSRREFLKLVGTGGVGLVLAIYLDSCAPAPLEPASATPSATAAVPPTAIPPTVTSTPTPVPIPGWEPSIYLKIDVEGNVTVTAFRSEMGQGIRTAIAMILAEELDADWSSIRIEQAPADPAFGDQVTGGSVSISSNFGTLRHAGAVARAMLVAAAAQSWDVAPENCITEAGFVIHPDGNQRLAYKDLAQAAAQLEMPKQVETKAKAEYRIMGTNIVHWDAPAILTGKATYGVDIRLPGMYFAAIARCPVFGGAFASHDDSQALAVPGVIQVVEMKDRIAVVAANTWAAFRGRDALQITWDEGRNADMSSASLRESAAKGVHQAGSVGEGSIDAVYDTPYEAHATMEPMNCTAYVHDGICEVWAPTQSPQDVRRAVGSALGFDRENVIVNVTLLGGGFGRRLQTDYAEEAALLSQAINAPVQVMWTRADDLQHDYYEDLSVMYASGSTEKPSAPHVSRSTTSGLGVPTGAWRSVENFPEAFAAQSFVDELAVALDRDPFDLRLELYSGRARDVIQVAGEKSNWSEPLPEGWGRGMAYHATFGVTHVAQVAEISVDDQGQVTVHRVVCAVDCGQVVNPDNVAAQMESGIVFGLTAAIKAQTTIENGRVQQNNFYDYPILRMDEMPVIEVYVVETDNNPSGIGEMGVPPIAPAIANAVYAATGQRVRHVPILPQDIVG